MNVVILEDEQDIVSVLRTFLRVNAPHVEVCATGSADQVLSLVAEHQPAVVILDHSVVGASSSDLVAQLKQSSPDSRICLFSSLDRKTLKLRAAWLGIPGFQKGEWDALYRFIVGETGPG